MNPRWNDLQMAVMRTIRVVCRMDRRNTFEVQHMHAAFNCGLVPTRMKYNGRRLWVAVQQGQPYIFTV